MARTVEIYTDGASRGNPGAAAWAFLFVKKGQVLCEKTGFIGRTTNNRAEYRAVIEALKAAKTEGWDEVQLYSDSELVIRQLSGRYRVRTPQLLPLWKEATALASQFSRIEYRSVPRLHPCISRADRLCNATLDRHAGVRRRP